MTKPTVDEPTYEAFKHYDSHLQMFLKNVTTRLEEVERKWGTVERLQEQVEYLQKQVDDSRLRMDKQWPAPPSQEQ